MIDERQRREILRGSGCMLPREILPNWVEWERILRVLRTVFKAFSVTYFLLNRRYRVNGPSWPVGGGRCAYAPVAPPPYRACIVLLKRVEGLA